MKRMELKKVYFHPSEKSDVLKEKAEFLKKNKDFIPWVIER